MSYKPIQTKKFKKILKKLGLEHIRTEGSHEIWDLKEGALERPVTIRGHLKEVPPLHIETSLENIGMSKKEFEDILKGKKSKTTTSKKTKEKNTN